MWLRKVILSIIIFQSFLTIIYAAPVNSSFTHSPHNTHLAARESLPLCTYTPTLCINAKFRDCENPVFTVNSCFEFPARVSTKVSSIKIPAPLVCNLYTQPGCVRRGQTEQWDMLTFYAGSDADLRSNFFSHDRAWNDRFSSMRCTLNERDRRIPDYCGFG
jgi:hypothetical protein